MALKYVNFGTGTIQRVSDGTLIPMHADYPDYWAYLAEQALTESDVTVLRCAENGIPVPAGWISYRASLRAIVTDPTGTTALPTKPAYPPGT